MANLQTSFNKFCEKIRLSKSKKESLISSREANRERIKNHFKNTLKVSVPDFFQQGSFSFKTTTNPLDGEFDVDDGIYLSNLKDDFIEKTKPSEVHNWIIDAEKKATKAAVKSKNNCVRIVYANEYHIDMPIYGIDNGRTYLACAGKDKWVENDPKGFNEWFYQKLNMNSEQMRKNIIYLKAWSDFNTYNNITGILLTVLVCLNQIDKTDRDDESLCNTVDSIIQYLKSYGAVLMPVAPYDDLLSKYSENQIQAIIVKFETLKLNALNALNEEDPEKAADHWIKVFGDRFICKDKDDNKKFIAPVVFPKDNDIRPWGK